MDLITLREQVRQFNIDRDWDKAHNPKDVVLAMVAEVGELAECFRWLSQEQVSRIYADPQKKSKIEEEIADIMIYLLILSYKGDIDLAKVVSEKLEKNKKKFPVDLIKGKSTNPIVGYKSDLK